jgi:putative hemolysin
MKTMFKATGIFAMATIFLLLICGHAFATRVSLSVVANAPSSASLKRTTLPLFAKVNPASAYCSSVGGTTLIQTRGDGSAYGLCQFTDNRACEQWALFHHQCPIRGVKITGFDTLPQQYCAWLGGKTLAVPLAHCTLPNGKVCNDNALYHGMCP